MAKRKPESEPAAVPNFEESLSELQAIVSQLEDGALGLETSLARFERGIGLLRECYAILEAAEARVEVLTRFQPDQTPVTAPFENSATFDPLAERTSGAAGNRGESPQETGNSNSRNEDPSGASLF